MNYLLADKYIKDALLEDIDDGDITTESIIKEDKECEVFVIAKEDGIICGSDIFKRVFQILKGAEAEFFVGEGEAIKKGNVIGRVFGLSSVVLMGERTALNFIQRMSGIATLTSKYVKELEGTEAKILDTRKTTPNFRLFEKYAVKCGGGTNHRYNLSDGVLIKDNHINAAGGIKEAIELARGNMPFVRKIEVETETIDMVLEALESKADIIMLDNMTLDTMREAIEIIGNRAVTEASGNITLDNINKVAKTGVSFISVGALTHSYKVLDLSMKNFRYI